MKSIDEQLSLIMRGAVELVSKDELIAKLKKGKPLRVKAGFDPTAPDLHLGHTVVMQKLRQFQDLGHTVIFLIGDFTARIGDPSGRNVGRPPMTPEDIAVNLKTYIDQASKILDPKKVELRYNSEWLGKMSFVDVVGLAAHYTLARMMEREDFKNRFSSGDPLSMHELLYPLMQGYDSVALEADVELGGTDQIFNLLVGRDLQRAYGKEPQVVLTMPLLVGTDGVQKMSKSYGNYIGITEAPENMFGKVMSISDELMWKYFELLSDRTLDEIKKMRGDVESGTLHPKAAKEMLAQEIVERYHGAAAASDAKAHFDHVIVGKGTPDEMESIETDESSVVDAITLSGILPSKSEARRMLSQGAVKINEVKITDPFHILKKGEHVLKIGKRKFLKVTVK